MLGALNDDVLDALRRPPPVSFGELAVGAAAAWSKIRGVAC
jgi:hypothetical protein